MIRDYYLQEISRTKDWLNETLGVLIVMIDGYDKILGELDQVKGSRKMIEYVEEERAKIDARKTAICEMLQVLDGCKMPDDFPAKT